MKPLWQRLRELPQTEDTIVVPAHMERELRAEAIMDWTRCMAGELRDQLNGKRVVWVETLGR